MNLVIQYDLHTHTTFSDGAHSLEMTVKFAEAVGLESHVSPSLLVKW